MTLPPTFVNCSTARADRRRRGGLVALMIGAVLAMWPAGAVFADPPTPTDFESEVVSIVPDSPTIALDVIGGDSFVRLRVEPGTTVEVTGYFGEPYLRIGADGVVEQNRRSPTVDLNADRYGASGDSSDTSAADATSVPEWEIVTSGGEFVWHDHRAHLMSADPPPGTPVGTVVSDQVIGLTVNGVPTEVRVVSVLQPPPSKAPMVAGVLVAAFGALVLLTQRWRQTWLLVVGGAAAAGIGWWQHGSVPPATEPSNLLYVLPGLAACCGVIALSFGRSIVAHALVLLGGLQLGVWVWLRRDGLARSVLPTDAPFWLDRAVTAGAGVVAVVAIVAGGIGLLHVPGFAEPEPAPTRSRSKAPARGSRSSKSSTAPVTTWGRKRPK